MANLKKILLVDDDEDIREALSEQLVMTEDFDVFEAGNGAEAMEKVGKEGVITVDESKCRSYFDCKVRKLFVYLPRKVEEQPAAPETEPVEVFEEKPQVEVVAAPVASEGDDLLFDVC